MRLVLLESIVRPQPVEPLKEMAKVDFPVVQTYDGCEGISDFLNDHGRAFVFVNH